MLEYLFLTCIAPLEAGMRLVLDVGYQWTHSWGWGIIFLSLCVNIVLLPLYHLAETWQEAERRVQGRMAAKLAEIRAVFRGQERYVMIRTLYRQHGYHPVFALRTSVGFLIQVPFFFAAYHFLDHAAFLRGVSFGPLSNLGAPDSLLALGGIHIHLLPFVMTLVNLLSALVYTQRLSRRDKVQLYGMAALFFVLLYPSASGLVLYWTCNNIFSLCKNIVYEKFHLLDRGTAAQATQKTPQAGTSASGTVACAVPGQGACSPVIAEASCMPHTEGENSPASVSASSARGRAPGNASTACCGSKLPGEEQESEPARTVSPLCDPTKGRRGWQRAVPWVLALLLPCAVMVLVHYCLLAYYRGDIWQKYAMQYVAAIGTAVLSLGCAIYGLAALRHTATTGAWIRKGVIVLALLLQALVLGRWFASSLDYFPRSVAFLVTVTACVLLALALSRHWRQALERYREEPAGLGYAALSWILAMVCLYTPVTLFASDPPFFDNSFALTGAKCTWLAVAILLLYALCSRYFGRSFRYISALFLSWIALSGACYSFLVTKDYGIFMGVVPQWSERLQALHDVWVDVLLLTVTAVLVIGIAARRRLHMLRGLYWAGTTITLAVAMVNLSTVVIPEGSHIAFPEESDLELPAWHDKLFGFSKDGTNVVVLVLDMFCGSHLSKIWEEYPELRAEFDGFIWYPDTLSPGICTILSIPSLVAGHELSPERHRHHDNTAMPLRERVQQVWGDYFGQLAARGFSVSIMDKMGYFLPEKQGGQLPGSPDVALNELPAVYRERWMREHHFVQKNPAQTLFPAVMGLFKLAPWSLRKVIYDKGEWLGSVSPNLNGIIKDVALFEQLARHANTRVQGNTYKFLHIDMTHLPWRMDITTNLPTEEDPYPASWGSYKTVNGVFPEHYYAEVCALRYVKDFLHWLKAAGIYDNTQVIVVSDHEFTDSLFAPKVFGEELSKGMLGGEYSDRPNALLLVKNRKSHGPLQKSAALMSSADVRLLIEADLDGTAAAQAPWNDPRRVRYHAVGMWGPPPVTPNFNIMRLLRITGSSFERGNWETVH